jgi:hypothetical protein
MGGAYAVYMTDKKFSQNFGREIRRQKDTSENLRMIILKRILNKMMLNLLSRLLRSSDMLFLQAVMSV